jgi:hypothetical protein
MAEEGSGTDADDADLPFESRRTSMSTHTGSARVGGRGDDLDDRVATRPTRRVSTETKAAFKTTELVAFIAAVIAVLVAASIVDNGDAGGLGARQTWLYVTILTVGYMVSRGLAKSGSREPYDDDR